MADLPAVRGPSFFQRVKIETVTTWSAWGLRLANLGRSLETGLSWRRFGFSRAAGDDMEVYAKSPSVYSAISARALQLARYPLAIGQGGPGQTPRRLDPLRVEWAAGVLRLLTAPSPGDVNTLFPDVPGEGLLIQLLTDLLSAGVAYVRPVLLGKWPNADLVGLERLHPRDVSFQRQYGAPGWAHRPSSGMAESEWIPVGQLCVIRLASIGQGVDAWRPIGPLEPLRRLLQAEVSALEATASKARQGGPDIILSPKDVQMGALLRTKEGREKIATDFSQVLNVEGGRRAVVLPGGLEATAADWSAADLQAPELMAAAERAARASIGATPAMLGSSDAGTYATAAIQMRAQWALDEALAALLEVYLFRPIAQHFARRAGGRSQARASEMTAWLDLSQHPGAIAARSEALDRMQKWVALGWTGEQAATIEGLDAPRPEGTPQALTLMAVQQAPSRPATPAQDGGEPNRPVGDATGRSVDLLGDFLGRPGNVAGRAQAAAAEGGPRPAPTEDARTMRWRSIEAGRERPDRDLQRGAQRALNRDLERYLSAVLPALENAARSIRAGAGDQDGGGGISYGPLNLDDALPDPSAELYLDEMGDDWLSAWDQGAADALADTGAEDVTIPTSSPTTLDPLDESSQVMAETSRSWVRDVVRAGMDAGRSPQEIAADLRSAGGFSESRALTIARTETVRAQADGANARYRQAAAEGVELELEWLSARDSNVRPEHRDIDGQRIAVSGRFRFGDGVETTGPGLSGDPSHDCNCRCASVARVKAD